MSSAPADRSANPGRQDGCRGAAAGGSSPISWNRFKTWLKGKRDEPGVARFADSLFKLSDGLLLMGIPACLAGGAPEAAGMLAVALAAFRGAARVISGAGGLAESLSGGEDGCSHEEFAHGFYLLSVDAFCRAAIEETGNQQPAEESTVAELMRSFERARSAVQTSGTARSDRPQADGQMVTDLSEIGVRVDPNFADPGAFAAQLFDRWAGNLAAVAGGAGREGAGGSRGQGRNADGEDLARRVRANAARRLRETLCEKRHGRYYRYAALAAAQNAAASSRAVGEAVGDLAGLVDRLVAGHLVAPTADGGEARRWREYRDHLRRYLDEEDVARYARPGAMVPLRAVFRWPAFSLSGGPWGLRRETGREDLLACLTKLVTARNFARRPVLLLGEAGSGKTSLLRVLAALWAANEDIYPVYVPLKKLAVRGDSNLESAIENYVLEETRLRDVAGDLDRWPNVVLLLDAFDEMSGVTVDRVKSFLAKVDRLGDDGGLYRSCTAVVSGRNTLLDASSEAVPQGAYVLELAGFDRARVEGWCRGWKDASGLGFDGARYWRPEDPDDLHRFVSLPLTLTMLACLDSRQQDLAGVLYGLRARSGSRPHRCWLFREIVERLCERSCVDQGSVANEDAARRLLQLLGYCAYHEGYKPVSLEVLRSRAKRYGAALPAGEEDPFEGPEKALLVSIGTRVRAGRRLPYSSSVPRSYEFVLRSFGEYLAAEYMARALAGGAAGHAREAGDGTDRNATWRELFGPRVPSPETVEFLWPMLACRSGEPGLTEDLAPWLRRCEELWAGLSASCTGAEGKDNALLSCLAVGMVLARELSRKGSAKHFSPGAIAAGGDDALWERWVATGAAVRDCAGVAEPADARRFLDGAHVTAALLTTEGLYAPYVTFSNPAVLRDVPRSVPDKPEVRLRGAVLRSARLRGLDLLGVDFAGADLAGADLGGSDISLATLELAGPAGARVAGARVVLPGTGQVRWWRVFDEWPFNAEEAARRRKETAESLGVSQEKTVDLGGGVGAEMVLAPAGRFQMGSPEGEEGRFERENLHEVVITRPFYVGRYPVTNEEYGRFLIANRGAKEPKYWGDRKFNAARQPVVGVSWDEARCFAEWAGGRLPSEAEWEYACRAGTQTRFWSGDSDSDLARVRWYGVNSGRQPHPVGEKDANAFGLHDIHGNVFEWCEDEWHDDYSGAPADGRAWKGESNSGPFVVRGGSWVYFPRYCRSACRYWLEHDDRDDYLGFRWLLSGLP